MSSPATRIGSSVIIVTPPRTIAPHPCEAIARTARLTWSRSADGIHENILAMSSVAA